MKMKMTNNPNSFLNATIALLRGDVVTARALFRETLDPTRVSEVSSKLYAAIDQIRSDTASRLLVSVMEKTMALEPGFDDCTLEMTSEEKTAFLLGVIAAEQIVNAIVLSLQTNGAGPQPVLESEVQRAITLS